MKQEREQTNLVPHANDQVYARCRVTVPAVFVFVATAKLASESVHDFLEA